MNRIAYEYGGGKEDQTKHWTNFMNNLIKKSGATKSDKKITTTIIDKN